MTLPVAYDHNPSARNYPYLGQQGGRNFDYTEYQEDIWVGYRYFDACGLAVAYPFGYGLSYTDFKYSDPSARRRGNSTELSVTVTNTGDRPARKSWRSMYRHPKARPCSNPSPNCADLRKHVCCNLAKVSA